MKDVKKKSSQSLVYKGQVKVELRKGKNTIAKTSYHNNGTIELFKFLAYCIKGSYSEVEIIRPKFIKLFTIGEVDDPNPILQPNSNTFNELVALGSTKLLSLSYPVYAGEPNVKINEDPDSVNTTFKFVVPFSQLITNQGPVNMIALYSQLNKYGNENASMFIIIDKESGTKLSSLWEEMEIDPEQITSNEYNLFIEWVTTFKNEGE